MATKELRVRVKHAYLSAAEWRSKNPILQAGEVGIESDTNILKIGSGKSNWSKLPSIAVKESYLDWGGKNFSGTFGCIDAAMVPDLGANRLAFGNAAGIKVEYSRDGGSTWVDYGLTDAQKTALFGIGGAAVVGNASASALTTKCMLRVTVDSDAFGLYTILNKFVIYLSTNGSTSYCTIDASLESSPTTFKVFADKVPVSGWSGYNVINTSEITTYGNSKNNQYGLIRFTFGCTTINTNHAGLNIFRIMGFGGVGWSTPSNMAKTGHLYSYDNSQNASFPAQVTATQFNGTATKATQDGDGNTISSTYLKLSGGRMTGTIRTVQDTKPAINFRNSSDSYGATINYSTAGNEALVINLKNPSTSFMVNTGVDGDTWTSSNEWSNQTPALQIKNNCVYINELISNNTTPAYTLNVNGTTNIKGVLTVGTVNSANVVKSLSVSGKTITVTKGDGTTSTLTTQDTVYTHPSSHPASMITGLAKVATSGSYSDLSNKPTIPTLEYVTEAEMKAMFTVK